MSFRVTSFGRRSKIQFFLGMCIECLGLAVVLDDQLATEGLRKHLRDRNVHIRAALFRYAAEIRPTRKRGPKPDAYGRYNMDKVAELKKQGKSYGQIAKELYNDPSVSKRVA